MFYLVVNQGTLDRCSVAHQFLLTRILDSQRVKKDTQICNCKISFHHNQTIQSHYKPPHFSDKPLLVLYYIICGHNQQERKGERWDMAVLVLPSGQSIAVFCSRYTKSENHSGYYSEDSWWVNIQEFTNILSPVNSYIIPPHEI